MLTNLNNLKEKSADHLHPYIALRLQKACNKLDHYYPMRDEDIWPLKNLYIATVLDPRFKLAIFLELGFPKSILDKI